MQTLWKSSQLYRGSLSASALKWIGYCLMTLDHVGVLMKVFYENSGLWQEKLAIFLRLLGRGAFPIFCFLLTEGFFYTRSKKKYAFRLFLLALISEIPFDLFMDGSCLYAQLQNVVWTLLFGLLTIWAVDGMRFRMQRQGWELNPAQSKGAAAELRLLSLGQFAVLAAGIGAGYLLKSDYGPMGVFLIFVLYFFRYDFWWKILLGFICLYYEPACLIGFGLILLASGRKGSSRVQRVFSGAAYLYYPIHLLVLYGIYVLIVFR